MSRRRHPLLAAAVAGALLPLASSPASAATFADTAGTSVEQAVEHIVAEGITQGCNPEGTLYCPGAEVSRGQMATFLVRALGLPPGTSDAFDDDDGSTHEASIDRVAEEGIAVGDGTGYRPTASVSRAQMATFLVRALDLPPADGNRFVDVAGEHEAAVNALAEAGITAGCDPAGTRYCPTDVVSRGQMATFLSRVLDLLEAGDPTAGAAADVVDGSGEGTFAAEDTTAGDLPAGDHDVTGETLSREVASAPSSPEDSRRYWTPERMAEADGDTFGEGSPELLDRADLSALMYDGEPLLAGTSGWAQATVPQVGKLYYTMPDGRPNVCSGTVVGMGLVLTAAHCVVSQQGDFTNFRFVPAMAGSSMPYGYWEGSRAYYFQAYLTAGSASWAVDYAFVHVPPTSSGTWLGQYTGTFPVVLNTHDLWLPKVALGYPDEGWFAQFGGTHLWSCSSSDLRRYDWGGGWYSKGSGCNANGGFSGGPVFEYWNGAWHVAAVNSSMTYTPAGTTRSTAWLINLWGPSFNDWYDSLLAAVQ